MLIIECFDFYWYSCEISNILLPFLEKLSSRFIISIEIRKIVKKQIQKFHKKELNFQKLDIEIPVDIPVNFMILTGTGIPANRPILTGTGILPGSRSILDRIYLIWRY